MKVKYFKNLKEVLNFKRFKEVSVTAIFRSIGVLLQLLIIYSINKRMGLEAMGIYGYFTGSVLLGSAISRFGLDQLMVKDESNTEAEAARGGYGYWVYLRALMAYMPLIVLLILLNPFGFYKSDMTPLVAISVFSLSIIYLNSEYLRARSKIGRALLYSNIAINASVYFCIEYLGVRQVEELIYNMALSYFPLLFISLFDAIYTSNNGGEYERTNIKERLSKSVRFYGVSVTATLLDFVPILLISKMVDMESLGAYHSLTKVLQLFPFLVSLFDYTFAPSIAKYIKQNNRVRLKNYFFVHTIGIFLMAILFAVVAYFVRFEVYWYFHLDQSKYELLFMMLLTAKVIEMCTGFSSSVLSMSGAIGEMLKRQTVYLCVYASGGMLVINLYGFNAFVGWMSVCLICYKLELFYKSIEIINAQDKGLVK